MVRAYAGSSGDVLHEVVGQFNGDWLASLAALGDIDGDGFDDFLVGAPGWGEFFGNGKTGRAQALSGQTGAVLWSVVGATSASQMGSALATSRDVDGDGVPEALLSAIGSGDSEDGLVQVHSGVNGALLLALPGGFNGDDFGAVVAAGDVNGDGKDDLLVGSPGNTRVRIFSSTCGDISSYGSGCPGTGGIAPTLAFVGCATPGGSVTITVDRGLGGSTAFLMLGFDAITAPIFGGCTLLVEPTPFLVALPLSGLGPGLGKIQLPATLAVPTPLVSVFAQAFVVDPGASHGWSTTPGIEFAID